MTQDQDEEILQKLNKEEEERITQILADKLHLPYFNLEFVKPDPDAIRFIPEAEARKLKIVGIKKVANEITLGVINPLNQAVKEYANNLSKDGYLLQLSVVSNTSLNKAWEEYRFLQKKEIKYTEVLEINPALLTQVIERIKTIKDIDPIVQDLVKANPFEILEQLMAGAMKLEASDIHLEPQAQVVEAKYRIDGILYSVTAFPKKAYGLIKNRIKVASSLLLNVSNKPQDGRFTIILGKRKLEIRVSTIPSAYDETIVMRILDVENILIDLKILGFRPDHYEAMETIIQLPNGLLLNTGPTGSGKTTTLYSILNKIKRTEINIVTIEDPIEYHLEGISQTQVDPRRGYTFANGLRSILRQDPDVILVGEIRDKETAQIAVHAALTGHLVVSTLHTNDSLGAIPRLIDLGVDKFLLPPSLRLIIAQRLVRKVCLKCRKESVLTAPLKAAILKELEKLPAALLNDLDFKTIKVFEANSCSGCSFTGYRGRIGIFELFRITPAIERIIYELPTEENLLKVAAQENFTSLRQDALIKLLQGITTLTEVERVTGPIE